MPRWPGLCLIEGLRSDLFKFFRIARMLRFVQLAGT